MSKITLDNLSDNLKAYLEGLGLSEEQVLNLINENGLDEEELKAMLKDTMSINELNTSSKTVIGAINELFQSANNGKELIASAIGEPVSSEDTFQAMSNDINGLLSTFKANMMNNGITVESGDKFKALIDKIATMVEEGSGKGIQFAEGIETIIVDYTAPLFGGADFREPDTWEPVKQISINVGFKPMYILLVSEEFQFCRYEGTDYSIPQGYFELNNMSYCNINYTEYGGKMVRDRYWYDDGTTDGTEFIFDRRTEINNTGFDLFYRFLHVWSGYAIQDLHANVPLKWIAIGVGEEDTTLRDSLASILQEEGVTVTEEDDMASLISKVDGEFDEKNNSKVEIEFSFEDMVELQYKGLDSEGYGFTASVWGIKTSAIGFKPSHMYIYSLQQPYQGYLWMNYNSMDDGTETMICTNIGNWFDWVFINITFTHNQGYKDIMVEPNNFGIPVYQYGGGTATKPSAGYKFKLVAYK